MKNDGGATSPLLTICIPTFERRDHVFALVKSFLSTDGPFEVRVHVDGSSDGTYEHLLLIKDDRLIVTRGANGGRANALRMAVKGARGIYTMLYDDDDFIYPSAIDTILRRCKVSVPVGVAGFIYHLDHSDGRRLGSTFLHERSNFLHLRADEGVVGDKKEIINTSVLQSAMDLPFRSKRIPTSLYWSRIALAHDILCLNESIGIKIYLPGGMTSAIKATIRRNPRPMLELHRVHIKGYFRRRYSSILHFGRSVLAFCYYGTLSLAAGRG